MKYRLLVVDDEKNIRSSIRASLEYLNIEFEEIREVSTGRDALGLLAQWNPNIVITDIQMPDMDGFAFIELAKKQWPRMKFMIVSGCTEFASAARAIELEVNAYLVKPLLNDQLKDAMTKLFATIQEEADMRHAVQLQEKMEHKWRESQFEMEINCLLAESGKYKISKEIYPILFEKYPWICWKEYHFLFAMINIDVDNFEENAFRREKLDLLRFSIKNVFHELTWGCEKMIVSNLNKKEQLYALFWAPDAKTLRRKIEKNFLEMKNFLNTNKEIYISVGISNAAKGLENVNYREAKEALEQRMVYGRSDIYFYEDVYVIKEFKFPVAEINLLRQYLERKDMRNTEMLIRELFSEERIAKYRLPYIRMMWMQALNLLVYIWGNDINRMDSIKQIIDSFFMIDEAEYKIDELREHYMRLIIECIGEKDIEVINAKNKVQMAIRYIEKHYYEDISVNQLAEQYDMNTNYFSTLIKKELNQSTVNYITELRLSKAKEFLLNSNKSAVEIAQMIGYEDTNYFFRVFKKKEGMSPHKYRELNSKSKNNRKWDIERRMLLISEDMGIAASLTGNV